MEIIYLKIIRSENLFINSGLELYPLTFSKTVIFNHILSSNILEKISNDSDPIYSIFIKKNRIYAYYKTMKIGPLSFFIENEKLSLTPFAVSKDGTKYFCCDNYIGDVIDTGTDIICVNENIFYIYDIVTKNGKYINLQKHGKLVQDYNLEQNYLTDADLQKIGYYYVENDGDLVIMITKSFSKVYLISTKNENTKISKIILFEENDDNFEYNDEKIENKNNQSSNDEESVEENIDEEKGKPLIQKYSKEYDINHSHNENLLINQYLIVKGVKKYHQDKGLFTMHIYYISFFIKDKNEIKQSQFSHEYDDIQLSLMENFIIKLNKINSMILIINRFNFIDLYYKINIHDSPIKIKSNLINNNIMKVYDACWLNQIIILLNQNFELIACNLKEEKIYFVRNNSSSLHNKISFNLIKHIPQKIKQETCFLFKNQEENSIFIFIDKQQFNITFEINTLNDQTNDLNCFFLNLHKNKYIFNEIIEKLNSKQTYDVNNLFEMYLRFRHYELDVKNLIFSDKEIKTYEINFSKIEKKFLIKLIEFINYTLPNSKIKLLNESKNIVYFPFINKYEKQSEFGNHFKLSSGSIKLFITFSIYILNNIKKNENYVLKIERKLKKKQLKNMIEDKNTNFEIISFISKFDVNSALKIIKEKGVLYPKINDNSIINLSINCFYLILFLENVIINGKKIKITNKSIHEDIKEKIKNKNFDLQQLLNFLKNESTVKLMLKDDLNIEELTLKNKKTINIFNLLLYLYDYCNLFDNIIEILLIYINNKKLSTEQILNLFLCIMIFLEEKKKLILRNEVKIQNDNLCKYLINLIIQTQFKIIDNILIYENKKDLKNLSSENFNRNISFELIAIFILKKNYDENFFLSKILYFKNKIVSLFKYLKNIENKDPLLSKRFFSFNFWNNTPLYFLWCKYLKNSEKEQIIKTENTRFLFYFSQILIDCIFFINLIGNEYEKKSKINILIENKTFSKISKYIFYCLKKIELEFFKTQLELKNNNIDFERILYIYFLIVDKFMKFENKSKFLIELFNFIDFLTITQPNLQNYNEKLMKLVLFFVFEYLDKENLKEKQVDKNEQFKSKFKDFEERNIFKNYELVEKEQNEELDNFKKLFIKFCIFEVSEISEGLSFFKNLENKILDQKNLVKKLLLKYSHYFLYGGESKFQSNIVFYKNQFVLIEMNNESNNEITVIKSDTIETKNKSNNKKTNRTSLEIINNK